MNMKYNKTPAHLMVEDYLLPLFPMDLREFGRISKIPHAVLTDFVRNRIRLTEYYNDKGMTLAKAFGRFFKTGEDYWTNIQRTYDLKGTL